MKEAIVGKGPKVTIREVEIPKPGPDQVVIKVVVSGSNPKDWKGPMWSNTEINQGDDIAGYVFSVGENITEFRPGDRVGAFHEMRSPGGSYAEYAVAWGYTTFHIPKKTSFEEAATLPLAAMTSAVALYARLGLPPPWQPATRRIPLLIYSGASAVGAFAIKLARLSNVHPIITTAGRGIPYVESLLDPSQGDAVVDYRSPTVVQDIHAALEKAGSSPADLKLAFDGATLESSHAHTTAALAPGHGHATFILPYEPLGTAPEGVHRSLTTVGDVHKRAAPHEGPMEKMPDYRAAQPEEQGGPPCGGREFGFTYFRLMARGLQEGWFTPHPYEMVPGGLEGVERGLTDLMDGKASAVKYVFRIADTPGVNA